MDEQKNCQNCGQKQKCQDIYRKMSNAKGPSVALDVVAAFLLPIAVFITVLFISENIFDTLIANKELQIIFGFTLAVLAVFVYILIMKMTVKILFTHK